MPRWIREVHQQMVYDLPATCGVTLKALAEATGREYSALKRETNSHDPGAKLGPEHYLEHIAEAGSRNPAGFAPLDYALRTLMNCVRVPLPTPDPTRGDWARLTAKLGKEFGEHNAALFEALADDDAIDAEEARTCLKEIRDLIQAAVACEAQLMELAK